MSVYSQYVWPVQNLTAVSAVQNIAANGSAVFNGAFANSSTNQISFVNQGYSRVVSITSTNNLSAATFTVSGTQNGAAVSENITGPNNTTVYGTKSFDVINTISTNATSNGVSIGTGDTGYLPIITVNNGRNIYSSYSIAAFVPLSPATGITYQGYSSIDNIANNAISFDTMINTSGLLYNAIFPANEHTSQLNSYAGTNAKYIVIHISASTHPTTDTLIASFYQN